MKIGFVSPRYWPSKGGIETLVQAIAERLVTSGEEVEVLTLVNDSDAPAQEVVNGVVIRRFRQWVPGTVFMIGLPLYRYLVEHRDDYDVINAHSYHAMPLFWSSLVCPERLVASTHYHGKGHSRLANGIHPFYRPLGSWAVRRAQRVICASVFEKELVAAHFQVAEDKIAIVPDGIPLDALQSAQPFDLQGIPLLYVGRLEKYKRVDLAIQALASLPEPYRLYVIGKGPDEPHLRQLVLDADLADRVTFLKYVPDDELFRWYRSARVLVMMSEAESFPMTSLEAMAAGCRVVCSPAPPFTELARDFPEEIYVTADTSPEAVARSIRHAAEPDGRAIADLGAYSWDHVAQLTLQIFKGCVSLERGA